MQVGPGLQSSVAPFRLRPPPKDAFVHPAWALAERQTHDVIDRGGRVLLLGLPGTGKTFLLQCLEQSLRGRGLDVHRLVSGGAPDGLSAQAVILIDEAGLLSETELSDIMRRPNPVVAAGLPSLSERFEPNPDAVRTITLEPLSPENVARFVIARLAATGRPRESFTPEALVALARQSGGLMRLVIILAGAALFVAEHRGAAKVTADDIDQAASMRSVVPLEPQPDLPPRVELPAVEAEAAEMMPAWLAAASAAKRPLPRHVVRGGRFVLLCASLGVIFLAATAAHRVGSIPMEVQEVKGRLDPQLAVAAVPSLIAPPNAETATPVPVKAASAVPPVQALSVPPGPPDLLAPRDAETSYAEAPPLPLAPSTTSPALADTAEPSTVYAFAGPIMNETMGRGGQLSLKLRTRGTRGPVAAVFSASNGLIGSGVLRGEMGSDGRITLSGRLMMGRNPFDCALEATLKGGRLVGGATFVRATSGASAHSSFSLTRL